MFNQVHCSSLKIPFQQAYFVDAIARDAPALQELPASTIINLGELPDRLRLLL
ncbi:hypothetical protein I6F21_27100 [Bradyrhizobium sp. NBAIM03]|uniref:hypothetical protein n=1 Tax=unclassified Bradyrhizobium TaxID=2631580 RepID=UPI001CD3B251|nr:MULTISPECIES: hypothetical protein [unclassified Bradyrhizobium]MCA1470986.1 hypothetical protein [Bradyrhizobium sp. IC3195]MCA1536201.1 hypothetical protein [Bradyrhizobium sp. NBAIM03]